MTAALRLEQRQIEKSMSLHSEVKCFHPWSSFFGLSSITNDEEKSIRVLIFFHL